MATSFLSSVSDTGVDGPSARWHRLLACVLGVLLLLAGALLTLGGVHLLYLGGSAYYLPAGLLHLAVGTLVCRGRRKLAAWLYGAYFIATLVWALAEAGPNFWLLLPRLGMPLGFMVLLLLPWIRRHMLLAAGSAVLLVVLAASLLFHDGTGRTSVVVPASNGGPVPDWADYGGNKAGTRFSLAGQITLDNVSRLKLAWSYRSGDLPGSRPGDFSPQMFEATPLQVDETLYLCTPRNIVIALDVDTGAERWRHDPEVDTTGVYTLACRGVAYHHADTSAPGICSSRILEATIDGRLIALDAETGNLCPDFGNGGEVSLRDGLGHVQNGFHFVTSPATIVGDVAVVGSFVLDNMAVDAPSGVVRAFDVRSGRQLWSWDAGRADPNAAPEPGETYVRGSPNAWSIFSADEKLGLVYIPTGNPAPDYYGAQRSPEMERYGSSVVALEARTGKLRWAFQTVHHDLWDFDVASQPVLVDLEVHEQTVPALFQATKQGEIFVLDRRDGSPIGPVEERPVPSGDVEGERYSPTQPKPFALPSLVPPPLIEADMWGGSLLDQLWCRIEFRKLRYEGYFTPPATVRTLAFPGNNGIMNWGSLAVDTRRGVLVVPSSYMASTLQLIPRAQAPDTKNIVLDGRAAISPMSGTPYAVRTERPFGSPFGVPCNAPPWGRLAAIDYVNHRILWSRPLGTSVDHAPLRIPVPGVFNQGGPLITAGGLVFIGATMDDYLRAFDLGSGKEVWKARLPAGGQATPMSYVSRRTGKQYVVIAAGGHQFMQTTIGDYVVAYALEDEER